MFIWRLAHNSLHIIKNLAGRGVKLDTNCPLCYRLDEDCGHLFFKCKQAKQCWRALNLEHVRAELQLCQSGKEIVMKTLNLQQEDRNRVLIWLWRWCSTCNKVNEGDKMPTIAEILSSVSFYLMEINKLSTSCKVSRKTTGARWESPPPVYYKVNVDASFHDSLNSGGWGFVAREWDDNFLEGGACNFS
jgi:hypothetical protein